MGIKQDNLSGAVDTHGFKYAVTIVAGARKRQRLRSYFEQSGRLTELKGTEDKAGQGQAKPLCDNRVLNQRLAKPLFALI